MPETSIYPRILISTILPIIFWFISLQDISIDEYLTESIIISLSSLIFYIFTLLSIKKYKDSMLHLNFRLKIIVISYFYTFVLTSLVLNIVNHNYVLFNQYLYYHFILLFLLIMSNEIIYKYFKKNIKIVIVGNQYELTHNDFILLEAMHIDYMLFKDLNSFILSSTHNCILVDNTDYKIGNYENIHNFDLISLDKFLEIYLRKVQFDKSPKSQFVIRYNLSEFILKKFIDFLVIIFFIPICLIIIPISFLIIKFQSTGNLIFMQNRVGKKGKVFKIIKIRSMHDIKSTDDFDEGSDEQVRIFPYGLFMRKTRIDEMPQFINVLKGQMHIAGPRAEWLDLHNYYNSKINNYYLRNNVAPGITGFAQVMFRYGRSEEDAVEKLMFDIYYIKNWSLWLEIEIGIRTISVMLRKKGI